MRFKKGSYSAMAYCYIKGCQPEAHAEIIGEDVHMEVKCSTCGTTILKTKTKIEPWSKFR